MLFYLGFLPSYAKASEGRRGKGRKVFGEFCPHPKCAKHEKPNRTIALALSELPSERGVSPSPSEGERCKHHKRSPPKRAVPKVH